MPSTFPMSRCGFGRPEAVGLPQERLSGGEGATGEKGLAACRAAELRGLLTQGIGLRPHPWAGVSRPVGPYGDVRGT
jgi:hypothetical protein